MFWLVVKVSGSAADESVTTLLFSVAVRDELVPAPSIAPPLDSVTWSFVLSALEAVRKMPGVPVLGVVGVSTSIMTELPIVTVALPVSVVVLTAAVPLRKPPAPAETVFPFVGTFSVKVFCAVMSTANEAMMTVLERTVAFAAVLSLLFARAPLAPAYAAFTELTSGV